MNGERDTHAASRGGGLRLCLCGDVMVGRGIDQILPFPSDPTLHEPYLDDARRYVELAEKRSGGIPRPVSFNYVWGDTLSTFEGADVRIINLETSVTTSDDYWPEKEIHYRMNPRNVECLTAARIDCCGLANNHVLDWGFAGLNETLHTLDRAGIAHAGAGSNLTAASAPAILDVPGKGRVLVFAYGSVTSGVPPEWAATREGPGVNLLDEISERAAVRIAREMKLHSRPGDVIVASIHWGPNWGYDLELEEVQFARRLIDEGVAIVHGHSSHHGKTVEVRGDGLILYGCGDFLNDYEGIQGYERFRGDLTLLYEVMIDPETAQLIEVRLIPIRISHFRLNRASPADTAFLQNRLDTLGAKVGTRVRLAADGSLIASAKP